MRVALCLVSTDQVWSWFAYDLAGLVGKTVAARPDLDLRRFQATGCELPDLREKTVTAALRAECDWCFFLDSDMRFPADALCRLLDHGVPVVGANYTMRRPPFTPVSVHSFGDPMRRVYTEAESSGLEAVAATGMGCLLVSCDVLRALKPPRFMIGYSPDDAEHMPEDLYFSRKLKDAGATIYVDHDLSHEVRHLGVVEFEADHAVKTRDAMKAHA